jgi:hypothetical protein
MFKKKEEEIKHEVTEEEVIENGLEGEVEAGEEVIIPAEISDTPEDAEEEVIAEEPKSGYRECTCGALVALPMEGEEATECECGVKHTW